jgi:hypothetical protein
VRDCNRSFFPSFSTNITACNNQREKPILEPLKNNKSKDKRQTTVLNIQLNN